MTMPNFFIAGVPKAGTDLLFYQLDQHPEIYMSPLKEPNFFALEVRPEHFDESLKEHVQGSDESMRRYLDGEILPKRFGGMVTSRADYERLFAAVAGERAVGEGSVCYLWSQTAAEKIAEAVPHAKIVVVLMDPAERAYHQYLKSLADGNVSHPLSTHLDLAFEDLEYPRDQIRLFNPYLGFGEYSAQMERFCRQFAPEQLSISIYEEVLQDYAGWFRRILDFLEVSPEFVPGAVDVPSKPHFANGAQPAFAPADRSRLVNYYRDDVLRLQDVLGRDLGHWLKA
jgi:Sulfotransferase family